MLNVGMSQLKEPKGRTRRVACTLQEKTMMKTLTGYLMSFLRQAVPKARRRKCLKKRKRSSLENPVEKLGHKRGEVL